ncbi:response regulator transcription factor [Chitinophaga alhagiae]|uniref:response regulator transcription factor n=1 Tax=Chitinophaga alhagiae TaxID=2203219 RepID=UPI000E5AACB7|nr:response regulator transcription factor [Chitinophaga alhagiae]
MNRILLTEDDSRVASFIKKGLEENMYLVKVAANGEDALQEATLNEYDIIILDIMLPELDGFEVCSLLRKRGNTAPVIMLSALNTPEEKVRGLQCGADDYLSKPFLFEELLARINAQLRRMEFNRGIVDFQRYGGVEINIAEQSATRQGKELQLSPRELKLLAFMVRNREKALSRVQIAQSVWDIHFSSNTNIVDVYINYLRGKLDKGFPHPLIHTVKGRGYMLKLKDHEPES